MHQKGSVRNIHDLNAVDVADRLDDLLIVCFARRIYRDIADQVVFSDAHDINALDIAAGLSDSGRNLTELTRLVVDPYPKREAVTCVRRRLMGHTRRSHDRKESFDDSPKQKV